jgi:adenylate cyclase class 2
MPPGLEVEIKLPVADLEAMARRLAAAGLEAASPRQFEDNWVFDFADGRLRRDQVMLRVRQVEDASLLTVKEKVPDQGDYKIRREYETEVADGEMLQAMLRALGLQVAYRYQKYRRTYRRGDLLVTLDELPIGDYLELEGPPGDIDRTAASLGFSRGDYINVSYRTLHLRLLKKEGLAGEPVEMVFPGWLPA